MSKYSTQNKRIVAYLRDSDELCSRTSIDDQMTVVKEYAKRNFGNEISKFYIDEDISGQTLGGRLAYARMLSDAELGKFDVVIGEAIDRLARRTADTTDLRDMLAYYGVELHAVNLGLVTPMHAAMMGLVAEQFSRDLAAKTTRGLRGATSRGKVTCSRAYGYKISDGTSTARVIIPEEAAIVLRIFEEFDRGFSPVKIADRLNNDGIPSPRGRFWNDSTIRGDAVRRIGMLRNELYIGKLVFGRAKYQKNPKTGKRRWRTSEDSPIVCSVPELRIIPDELWDRVQSRLSTIRKKFAGDRPVGAALNRQHRSSRLLSGLIKCGNCGSNFITLSSTHYGCGLKKSSGNSACQAKYIRMKTVETRVVNSIRKGLASQEAIDAFVKEARSIFESFTKRTAVDVISLKSRLVGVETKISNLLDYAESGLGDANSIRERIRERETERQNLQELLNQSTEEPPQIPDLPNFEVAYDAVIRDLRDLLSNTQYVHRANEILGKLIERVEVKQSADEPDGWKITIFGDLGRILETVSFEEPRLQMPGNVLDLASQTSVVAGAGFEPAAFRL